jgi:hypothetical protein
MVTFYEIINGEGFVKSLKVRFFCHSGEGRNPILLKAHKSPGLRFSPERRLLARSSRLDKDRRFNIFYFSVAGSSVEDLLQGRKSEETALEKTIRR